MYVLFQNARGSSRTMVLNVSFYEDIGSWSLYLMNVIGVLTGVWRGLARSPYFSFLQEVGTDHSPVFIHRQWGGLTTVVAQSRPNVLGLWCWISQFWELWGLLFCSFSTILSQVFCYIRVDKSLGCRTDMPCFLLMGWYFLIEVRQCAIAARSETTKRYDDQYIGQSKNKEGKCYQIFSTIP